MQRLRAIDWEAIAGIAAAVTALVLHLVDVADTDVLLIIIMILLALILLRDLRREARDERAGAFAARTEMVLQDVRLALSLPDTVLLGPTRLRPASTEFVRRARGDMVWFNVCLGMFVPQALFDALLRPAVENPRVTSIQFVLDQREQALWESAMVPKLAACTHREKVREPRWCTLVESVSCIITETEPQGTTEALLSFWGEPFMARATGRDVPRYIVPVQGHSELIARLRELERGYRLGG